VDDLVDYLRARIEAEGSDCGHADRIDVSNLGDADRRLRCKTCSHEWTEARE
jgi:predicted Zn finger-like uncharacterized protein